MIKISIICKAFKTQIYPTEEQIKYFNNCFGVARFAYNWYLENNQLYYNQGINKSYYDLRKEFNDNRNSFDFVFEVNNRIYTNALKNANIAYKNFFKKLCKYPKFKSKKYNKQSFSTERCLLDVSLNNRRYKKYKSKFNGYYFYISGKHSSPGDMNGFFIKTSENIDFLKNKNIYLITISKHNNKYYVSFEYKEDLTYKNNSDKIVGIDLGLKTFATQSDGKISKLPKQKIIKIENKIKVFQRILSKKQKDSNNYLRTKSKMNKCYQKITNIKKDFLHKYTTYLAKNYKTIKIEDLDITQMMENKRMAKSIQRSNFFEFRLMLNYKCEWYDSNLIVIDRWYASSKICSHCGNKKKRLKLSERKYICEKCGLEMDRDLNAAINIANYK